MLIETKKLEGAALDWAVATLDGYSNLRVGVYSNVLVMDPPRVEYGAVELSGLNYHSNWDLAGPIIEQEGISFREYHRPGAAAHGTFYARVCRESGQMVFWSRETSSTGPTAIIAAMRCFVRSKLGEWIEVPDELQRNKE